MSKSIINEKRGVSFDEFYAQRRNAVKTTQGATSEHQRGVPMSDSGFVLNDECQGVTKTGESCKARPVKGRFLCVGHLKKAEAEASK